MAKVKGKKTKRIWIFVAVFALATAGAAGYYLWGREQKTAVQAETTTYQTAQVRQGSLVISATGSGTLVAGKEANLSFSTSGTVAAVNVSVGDTVQTGDVLAELDAEALASLQSTVEAAQLDLLQAQQALDDLTGNAGAAIASAELALADAQEAYDDASSSLKWEGLARCDAETTDAYYQKYLLVQERLDRYGNYTKTSDIYEAEIKPIEQERDRAYTAYRYCAEFTGYEITASQATLVKAEAGLKTAQADLLKLQENSGIDPDELAQAKNTAAKAELALAKAQKNLAGASIVAPFDGTVLTVAGDVGDSAGTSTFITLADLAHPRVEFYVDETDFAMVAVGYEAEVVFDALPDSPFAGKVVRVNPSLTTSNMASVLGGVIEIDMAAGGEGVQLPAGLSASVEIIGGKAENALLAPVEALHDLGDGQYSVFVLVDGEPKLRVVEVGIMDYTYAEVISGLALGDLVTTGITETN